MVWNVEMNIDDQQSTHLDITIGSAFFSPNSSISGTVCNYRNLMKEVHYTAFIGEDKVSIASVVADVVYIDLIEYPCVGIDLNLN